MLIYLKYNQNQIRAELYKCIQDALLAEYVSIDSSNIGKQIILPSSFIGCLRHIHQLYQNAMSVILSYGKPDLFITFTCNPNLHEITKSLLKNQIAADRPYLCARAFHCKLKEL